MQLRGQYTLVIGGLVCASLLVLGAALLVEQKRYAREVGAVAAGNLADTLERQIEKEGLARAFALASRLAPALYRADIAQIVHEAEEQRGDPSVVSALVVDAEGRVIRDVDLGDDGTVERLELPWARRALTTGNASSHREQGRMSVAAPVKVGRHVLGAVVLELATDSIRSDIQVELTRLDGLIRSQSTAFSLTGLGIGVMLVSLSVLSAIGVAGGLSGPIVDFAARARRIGRGELLESGGLPRRDEIGDLSRAFDEMASTLQQTTVSKDHFDNVLRSMAEMLLVTDVDDRIVTANPSCLAELGCREEDLRGRRVDEILPEEALRQVTVDPSRWFPLARPGGGHVPVQVSVAPLRNPSGAPTGRVLVLRNVAERLAAERQQARSLVEKEILLREIHHRVKNNLQIVSSMLSLQAGRSDDADIREIFHESEARIRAMALVHEQLYRSGDLAHVDLQGYLTLLSEQVIRYFGRNDCRVDVRVDPAARHVNLDQAIPIGLIVNELVANSIRHGFARDRGGLVEVRLAVAGAGRRLSVTDDGAGFGPDLHPASSDSLGLKLVEALAGQLGGTLTMHGEHGARFVIDLPAAPAAEAPPAGDEAATKPKERTTA
jgi:PAS domain S-box-containing protein